jgi:hypothetical protein
MGICHFAQLRLGLSRRSQEVQMADGKFNYFLRTAGRLQTRSDLLLCKPLFPLVCTDWNVCMLLLRAL